MRKLQMLAIALAALSFITAYLAYSYMPESMASHWDINGEVNGHMERGMGTYFMPILSVALLALFLVLPKIDPLRKNYAEFQDEYDGMVAIVLAFLYYIYLLTLAYNASYEFNLTQLLAPAFGALFIYMGIVLAKAKQNWFVGIRTPWTLSSTKVWNRTHAMGSRLFMAAGVVALLGIALPQMFIASIAVVIGAAIATFVYSYVEYRKEMREEGKKKKGKN